MSSSANSVGARSLLRMLPSIAGMTVPSLSLMAPPSLHWEIGNALAAMFRRGRIDLTQAHDALALYRSIAIRFVNIDLEHAVALAYQHNTYAYDAYMLACALRYNNPLLSLDARLNTAARAAGITVMEVTP